MATQDEDERGTTELSFEEALQARFDELVAGMNRPGVLKAATESLFGDPAGLIETYRPGSTETIRDPKQG